MTKNGIYLGLLELFPGRKGDERRRQGLLRNIKQAVAGMYQSAKQAKEVEVKRDLFCNIEVSRARRLLIYNFSTSNAIQLYP